MTESKPTQTPAVDIVAIPYNLLILGRANVRTVKPEKAADKQLIASIRAKGVLQNIVVKSSIEKQGLYDVIAGGRRWSSVGFLVKNGEFPDDYQIPAKIETEGSSAETSLAENIHAPMHPADEFAAFAAMRKDGMIDAEIADHFGVSKQHVSQRLRLADVHPKILTAYRKGVLNLETVMAFTLAESKKQQLAVFTELGRHCYAHGVRKLLTNNGATSDSSLAKYVTVEAYKAAGGSVMSDLFESRAYLPDVELLQELATAKLEKSAARLQKKEGWQNVEVVMDRNQQIHQYHWLEAQPVDEPSDISEALRIAIESQNTMENSDEEWSDERSAQFDELSDKIEGLETKLDSYRQYSEDDKQKAKCFVSVDHNGKVVIDRGLVTHAQQRATDRAGQGDGNTEPASMPKALAEDLGIQRQHIAKAALAKNAPLASDLLLYTLASQVLERHSWATRAIDANFNSTMPGQPEVAESLAALALEKARSNINTAWLTDDSVAVRFAALRKLSPKAKQSLLAYCVAECLTVNFSQGPGDDIREAVLTDLAPDYAGSWRPSGENYFRRLTIPALLAQGAELFGDAWKEQHRSEKKKDIVGWFDAFFNEKASDDLSGEHREIREHWLPTGFEAQQMVSSQS